MRNGLTHERGGHIVIEGNTKLPNVVSKGISVNTATQTMIALQTVNIVRLPSPYASECVETISDPRISNLYNPRFRYSTKSCNSFCYLADLYEICKCYDAMEIEGIALVDYNRLKTDARTCNITESSRDLYCTLDFQRRMFGNQTNCGCNPDVNA